MVKEALVSCSRSMRDEEPLDNKILESVYNLMMVKVYACRKEGINEYQGTGFVVWQIDLLQLCKAVDVVRLPILVQKPQYPIYYELAFNSAWGLTYRLDCAFDRFTRLVRLC